VAEGTHKIIWVALLSGGAATVGSLLIRWLIDRSSAPHSEKVQILGPDPRDQVSDVMARYGVELRSIGGRVEAHSAAISQIGGRVSSLERRVSQLESAGAQFGAVAPRAPAPVPARVPTPTPARETLAPWSGPEEVDAAVRRFQLLELD
jgi:hypothetical protein